MESIDNIKKIPLKEYWNLLSHYFKPMLGKFILLAVILMVGITLQLVNPFVLRYFIDTAMAGGEEGKLYKSAILFIGIALAHQGLGVLVTYYGETVGWSATNALRSRLVEQYLSLDMSHHKKFTSGEMIERIDGDVNTLQNFFSHFVVILVGNLVLLVGVLVLLYREDWRIGLAMTMFVFFALFAIERIRSFAVPYWQKVRKINGNFFGFLSERLTRTEDIRSNGGVQDVMRRFYDYLKDWLPVLKQAQLRGYMMWMTTILVFTIGNAVAFGMGAYLLGIGTITLGTVFLIFQFTELLVNPIEKIRNQMEDLQKADASIKRVGELLSLQPQIQSGTGAKLSDGALSVSFEKVSFGYEENLNVLENIQFHLEEKKVLGLLGRTGSGKSTIARLLLRFYDPTQGAIELGGVDIRETDLRELRKQVGIVTQDVQLFQASLRDNLTIFEKSISDGRILAVIRELGLNHWYESLPNGLDTQLLGDGVGLSAGQAQLLALTRVFLSDPGLVILDEASSRLDPASELMIENAMTKLLENRTAIIIAHRLVTVERVDEIMGLEDGHIVEYGERHQLANDHSSRFYRLLNTGSKEILV
ncbi:helicase [Paenibacillus dendritiformis]|uniref:ABC transporter ATP-binding protein n=1 Tax=Paenibacillus dendritiformis TaxID=130049 RepID=UPI0018CE0D04|nr:ABC transporter ATP-binding protein [Paenibacillus dendritiformis]MBG9795014.1 helicase [Paenibacillus dendritiformis]